MSDEPRRAGDDLSPAEQRAFDALPREVQPSPSLEERTVALLRAHGHLPIPITSGLRAPEPRRRMPAWVAGAVAAGVALFASGVAFGQYLGTRSALSVAMASRAGTATEAARHIERAGELYVTALASLSQLSDTADAGARAQARHAAITALGAAAEEIVHLAPNDPLAAYVLRGLDQRSREQGSVPPSRSVVWF